MQNSIELQERRGAATYDRPYWYRFDELIEGGAYFGFWCVEAVAAVKAFQLDDSLCLGLPDYPADLPREAEPISLEADELAERVLEGNRGRSRRSLLKRFLGKA